MGDGDVCVAGDGQSARAAFGLIFAKGAVQNLDLAGAHAYRPAAAVRRILHEAACRYAGRPALRVNCAAADRNAVAVEAAFADCQLDIAAGRRNRAAISGAVCAECRALDAGPGAVQKQKRAAVADLDNFVHAVAIIGDVGAAILVNAAGFPFSSLTAGVEHRINQFGAILLKCTVCNVYRAANSNNPAAVFGLVPAEDDLIEEDPTAIAQAYPAARSLAGVALGQGHVR